MRYLLFVTTVFISTFLSALSAQQEKLVSGPMLGYTAHHEQLIWLEVAPSVEEVAIRYWQQENPDATQIHTYDGELGRSYNPLRLVLTDLAMSTDYGYEIILDGEIINSGAQQQFTTTHLWEWREPAPDFSFLFGSCTYVNDSIYDRPGEPYGQGLDLLTAMGNMESDFMLWGGDNTYLREADWSSENGIYYRFSHDRAQPEMARLLATRPNFAIWDDHDFGPNNSNRGWKLKDATLDIFHQYWGHQTAGEPDNPGAYTHVEWSDADLFLLDNRYHRSPHFYNDSINGGWNPEKDYLGDEQMEWLKTKLASSRAAFKFVVSGSQVINMEGRGECFCDYQEEWQELLGFIREYDVRGVVFLSGDRHFSEMLKYEQEGMYPLYEITSSPMSSRPYRDVRESPEGDNPLRVEGTLTNELNFMKLSVSGERRERVLTIECFDKDGSKLWTRELQQQDLRLPRE